MSNANIGMISIIIPCYNMPEELIMRALDSVMAQTYNNFEVIIVDDGSTIAHHKTLEHIATQYDTVTLITTSNNGVSQARNIGVAHATGEYIAFVDADDILSKFFLEESYKAAQQVGADFVIGGTKTFNDIAEVELDQKNDSPEYFIYRDEEIRKLYCNLGCLRQTMKLGDSYLSRGPVARLIRKPIAEATPFHKELRIGEDGIWNLEILSKTNIVCVVKSCWYWYWMNPNSATHRYDPDIYSASKNYLIHAERLLDTNRNQEYLTYIYGIFDHLYNIQKGLLSYKNKENSDLCKKVVHAIYTEEPWIKIKENRFFQICPIKYKIMSMLYRFNLLMLYWETRGRLHK